MRIRNGLDETIQLILRTEDGTTFFRTPLPQDEVAVFTLFTGLDVKQDHGRPIEILVRTGTAEPVPGNLAFGGDPREITDGDGSHIEGKTLTLLNATPQSTLRYREGAGQVRSLPFNAPRDASGSQVEVERQGDLLTLLITIVPAANV